MKKCIFSCFLAGFLWLSVTAMAQTQQITKEQGDIIIEELRQIRQLLQRQQQPPAQVDSPTNQPDTKVRFNITKSKWIGKDEAPLTMVLFMDYQCPFCVSFETQTMPELNKQYISTGKLRFMVQDMPLDIHPNAFKAAEGTHCAEEQGKYWEFRERLIANPQLIDRAALPFHAQQIGLNVDKFTACLTSNRYAEMIKASYANATSQKVTATPSMVIGKQTNNTVDGIMIVGSLPFETLDLKLKNLLKEVSGQ